MVDFSKIMNESPDDRARRILEIETRYADEEASRLLLIKKRSHIVLALEVNIASIPEKDHRFIRDLAYQSSTCGMAGILGDRLADLSEKQVQYMEGLAKQHLIVGYVPESCLDGCVNEQDGRHGLDA